MAAAAILIYKKNKMETARDIKNEFYTSNLATLEVLHAEIGRFFKQEKIQDGRRHISIYKKARMETARDSLHFESRHIQLHFLKFSAFYICFPFHTTKKSNTPGL